MAVAREPIGTLAVMHTTITTNHHRRVAVLATALGLAAAALALGSGSATAAGPACGTVVTDDLVLTADLVGCAGPALVVGAPGITIDLSGHTISGGGTGAGIDDNGGHDGVAVEGGTITGFTIGIELLEADGARIEDLALTGNQVGVAVARSTGVRIEGVHADDNGSEGVEIGFSARARPCATRR